LDAFRFTLKMSWGEVLKLPGTGVRDPGTPCFTAQAPGGNWEVVLRTCPSQTNVISERSRENSLRISGLNSFFSLQQADAIADAVNVVPQTEVAAYNLKLGHGDRQ
jgi:hypothetical protein